MNVFMKTYVWLLGACLTGSASAQISNSLDIQAKMLPGADAYSKRLSLVMDTSQLADAELDQATHPLHGLKQKLDQILSSYGKLEEGSETGFGRSSYQVSVDLLRKDTDLLKDNKVIARLEALQQAFAPYQQQFLSPTIEGGVPYVELRGKTAEAFEKFFLCVVLDYKSHIAGTKTLTHRLESLMQEQCSGASSEAELQASLAMLSSDVALSTGDKPVDFRTETGVFSPFALEDQLLACRDMSSAGLSEMIKLGWFTSNDPLSAIEGCRSSAYHLFYQLPQDLSEIFSVQSLRSNITPYYRSLLLSLVSAQGPKALRDGAALEQEFRKKIFGLVTLENGFTKSQVLASTFNLAAFQKAAADMESSPYEVLGALLSPTKNAQDALRREWAAAGQKQLASYQDRLLMNLTESCELEAFKPACIRKGLAFLDQKQAHVRLQYGLSEPQVWDGYYLFEASPKAKAEPDL